MSLIIINELIVLENSTLSAVITYWKDYEANKVLMAYALLKKRNHLFSVDQEGQLREFEKANGNLSMDVLLENYLSRHADAKMRLMDLSGSDVEVPQGNIGNKGNNRTKYPALNIIITVYKVAAWVIGIFAVLSAVIMLSQSDGMGAMTLLPALGIILAGGLLMVGLIAIAESIKVFIDIEYNTRNRSEQ